MIFGDRVAAATTVEPAAWIAPSRSGIWGTVGDLLPNRYASMLRVAAPDPPADEASDWWAAYRRLFEVVAAVGARHTSDPDRAWFAVWEGHGFANATTHYAVRGPLDDATRRALAAERQRLRDEDDRRNAAIRAALGEVPTFDLPHRTYHLLAGPVAAAIWLREPNPPPEWRLPDLFWPDDRRWFVATDVDFWSLYVGGDHEFTSEIARDVPTATEIVPPDHRLAIED